MEMFVFYFIVNISWVGRAENYVISSFNMGRLNSQEFIIKVIDVWSKIPIKISG